MATPFRSSLSWAGGEMEKLRDFLRALAEGDLLSWHHQSFAANYFGMSLAQVERIALESGILPARYQRNRKTISIQEQSRLFRSHVAVIGCGGLGGYVIEELTRLGVGRITAVDPDVFEEHNLNRQLLSSPENIGQSKVEAARERVAKINPAVTLVPIKAAFNKLNGFEMLQGADVIVDALDSIPVRLELSDVSADLKVPLVHGAIGGWYGQVATQFPGENTLRKIYNRSVAGTGIEKGLGNPSFTPAVIASLQVVEVCKILIGHGTPMSNRKIYINLLDMEFEEIKY
jgi:molybdopterin/thiamine biosynthesis adenylyltransferase